MDTMISDCTAVVLAGGENRRMPVLKAFIEINGEKIIERNLKVLQPLFRNVFIVTNQPELYTYLGVPMLGDIHDTRGPLTGIFTALINSPDAWTFICACDMPFISAGLIRYLASMRNGGQAVVPLFHKKAEPLLAFYKKGMADSMERALMAGRKSIRDFLNVKRVKYISAGITEYDPEGKSFINLNTPEDIIRYLTPEDISGFNQGS